jgi:hypothetical protein
MLGMRMAKIPSIKGSLLTTLVEPLSKLLADGQVSHKELSRRLDPSALELLDRSINVSEWYDIRFYKQFVEAYRDCGGDGSDDSAREIGALAAERLLTAGLYQQLEYLSRSQVLKASDPHERFLAFGRDLRLTTTLGASVFNFGVWESKLDPNCPKQYVVEIREASAYPDVFICATEGFINRMAAERGTPDLWRGGRPRVDLIRYRMTRSL